MRPRSPAGSRRWASSIATVALFAALCGVATYWILQLFAPRVAIAPAGSLVDWQKAPDLQVASRLFGAPPSGAGGGPAAAAPSNIRVLGVAASNQRAAAVLSVDGKPPVAFLAGSRISDSARLLEVHPDSVVIEQGGSRLEVPAPQRPDLKVLSGGASQAPSASLAAPVRAAPAGQPRAGAPGLTAAPAPASMPGSAPGAGIRGSAVSAAPMPMGEPPPSRAAAEAGPPPPPEGSAQADEQGQYNPAAVPGASPAVGEPGAPALPREQEAPAVPGEPAGNDSPDQTGQQGG